MKYFAAAVRVTALVGLVSGIGLGVHQWSPLWPKMNWLVAARESALGWLVGLALAPLVGWLWSRRARGLRPRRPHWPRRAFRAVWLAAAVAPVGLWATVLPSHGLLRRALGAGPLARDSRPNLILITIDTLRADHLGVYGDSRALTPHLDAFAAHATRYDAAYADSPWTLLSFAAIFALRPPSECGLKVPGGEDRREWYANHAALPADRPVVPEQLRRAGYVTAAEITNTWLKPERGTERGFAFYRNETEEDSSRPELSDAERVTTAARGWLQLNGRKPFFLWVHYFDPHAYYDAPTTPPAVRARFPSWRAGSRGLWEGRMKDAAAEVRAEYEEYCRLMYAEEVKYADRWVGKLLQDIRNEGLWDRSLIVIAADHGEELFDHGGFEHGHSLHQEVLRVPLLVKWPRGTGADRQVTQTVSLASVGATLLRYGMVKGNIPGGAPPLPRYDGGMGQEVYSEGLLYGAEQTASTTDAWRVICHPGKEGDTPRFEVYDRQADPDERHDLAGTGAAAELRARLLQRSREAQARADRAAAGEEPRRLLTDGARRDLEALGYLR